MTLRWFAHPKLNDPPGEALAAADHEGGLQDERGVRDGIPFNPENSLGIAEPDQAIDHHERYKGFSHAWILRLPADVQDILQDARRCCRLGQWYAREERKALREDPSFIRRGRAHEPMVNTATKLPQIIADDQPVVVPGIDPLRNLLDCMVLESHFLADRPFRNGSDSGCGDSTLSDDKGIHAIA